MTIDERLEVLERELARTRRRQRFMIIAATMALVAVALVGFANPATGRAGARQPAEGERIVRARMFVVEDENGKVRAKLGLDDAWAPGIVALHLLDEDEAPWFGAYGSSSAGGSMSLFDKHHNARAHMSGDDHLGPGLKLFDSEGEPRAKLCLFDGRPTLEMSTKNGKLVAGASIKELGPHLGLMDSEGNVRVALATVANSVRMEFLGSEGELRAQLSADANGTDFRLIDGEGKGRAELAAYPSLRRFRLVDDQDQPIAALGASNDGSMFSLFDKDGQLGAGFGFADSGPDLRLFDAEGKARASLTLRVGEPALRLYDSEGRVRASVGASTTESQDGKQTRWPESSLLLFGPDGKLRWWAP